MKLKRTVFLAVVIAASCHVFTGCKKGDNVTIKNMGSYYKLTIDYTVESDRYETGKRIGNALLRGTDSFEKRIDSFIALTAKNYGYPDIVPGTPEEHYRLFIGRVKSLKPLMPAAILNEISGAASCFSGGESDVMNDGKLSINEYFLMNLIIEATENTECCAVSAFGSASKSGSTITARIMDWYIDTDMKEVEHLFGITEFRFNGFKLHTVGIIGHLGLITGIRDNGVYSAVLFSRNNTPYISSGKHSLSMELRHALENYSSIEEVSLYMKSKERNYTMNHNIYLADKKRAIVLENDVQGGADARREIREWNSKLNPKVNWGFENRLACVNSFILYGNDDNHTTVSGNQNRWLSMLKLFAVKKPPLSVEDLRSIITYFPGSRPGDFDAGGLYTKWSKQVMLFNPADMTLQIFFSPKQGDLPVNPKFETISLK